MFDEEPEWNQSHYQIEKPVDLGETLMHGAIILAGIFVLEVVGGLISDFLAPED